MPLKILCMLDSLNRGGAETLWLDICHNAKAAGLDLTFVASGGGDLENDFATSGVDFVRLQRRLPIDPALVLRLRKIISDRQINIVHAQQAVEAMHLWLATRSTGVKCVMTLHNYISDAKNRRAARFILPKLDAIVPVSEWMHKWYAEEGFPLPKNIRVVYNGVDSTRLHNTQQINDRSLREELDISKNEFKVF